MVRAFIWKKSGGDLNLKSFSDFLNALKNSVDDELKINIVENKRFLIKWLDEGFSKKTELLNILKDPSLDFHKMRNLLVEKLTLLIEK